MVSVPLYITVPVPLPVAVPIPVPVPIPDSAFQFPAFPDALNVFSLGVFSLPELEVASTLPQLFKLKSVLFFRV